MKIRGILACVLALAAGALSFGQISYNTVALPGWIGSIRTNAPDVSLLTTGTVTAPQLGTLASLPGLAWTSITNDGIGVDIGAFGSPNNPFKVGNNGSFDIKLEIAYIAKNSLADNSLSAGLLANDQLLYGSYSAASTAVWSIGGPAVGLANVTLFHTDASVGLTGNQANGDIFHVFTAAGAGYQYFIIGIDDEGTLPISDRDYNDGIFVARINTAGGAVPEPSTYGLLGGAALLGVLAFRRLKRQRV